MRIGCDLIKLYYSNRHPKTKKYILVASQLMV